MRLPNGQGLLHECRVFRNRHTSSLPYPHSQFKESNHCRNDLLRGFRLYGRPPFHYSLADGARGRGRMPSSIPYSIYRRR
jgi:hypothetical protein